MSEAFHTRICPTNYCGIWYLRITFRISGFAEHEVSDLPSARIATTQSSTPKSAELLAAQRKAQELEQQLATIKTNKSNNSKLYLTTLKSL